MSNLKTPPNWPSKEEGKKSGKGRDVATPGPGKTPPPPAKKSI